MSKPKLSDEQILNMICTALVNILDAMEKEDAAMARLLSQRLLCRVLLLAGTPVKTGWSEESLWGPPRAEEQQ